MTTFWALSVLYALPESFPFFQVAQKTSLQPLQVQERVKSLSESGYTVIKQKGSIWELLSVIATAKGKGQSTCRGWTFPGPSGQKGLIHPPLLLKHHQLPFLSILAEKEVE